MDTSSRQQSSQLFTVRIWTEWVGDGRREWRGYVQHVLSGEARYFREWPQLIAFLERVSLAERAELQAPAAPGAPPQGARDERGCGPPDGCRPSWPASTKENAP